MKVELRIYGSTPARKEYETIEREVPAFWPVPQSGSYIVLDNTDHPTIPEGETDVTVLAVLTSTYEYNSDLAIQRVVLTTEKR